MGPRRLGALLLLAVACVAQAQESLRVGSKRFTESYILGELLAQIAGAEHKPGLGNTAILQEALRSGAIDVYPEYVGTIAREILKTEDPLDLAAINQRLQPLGLPQAARGLDHGLAYEALAAAEIDVMDLYSTDAKIERYRIAVLEDDRRFFPAYDALLLHRADAPARFPAAFAAFRKLEGRIDAATMVRLNARAEIDRIPFAQVASEYLGQSAKGGARTLWSAVFAPDFGRLLAEHLGLVFGSLVVAALIGIPLGMLAARSTLLAQPVLVLTGLVQTVPSLALLAFLIPLTGTIGVWPALIALFLYALLPITRNTHAGIVQVPKGLVHAGTALGLTSRQILAHVKLPLALPTIMAGVKTSAVINVGTATIAAFIGAGGFGERISQGLALNDHAVLLAGALPAAALALAVHALFEVVEWTLLRRSA